MAAHISPRSTITYVHSSAMTDNDKTARHNMIKRVEAKDDGRVLIYYTFESADQIRWKETHQQVSDSEQPSEQKS